MSVLFGRWNTDGQPTSQDYLERVLAMLAPYGPDPCAVLSDASLALIHRPFHTTDESRRETQPHRSKSGAIVSWDGRLDNRRSLIDQLHGDISANSTDVEIVAAAFDRWATDCFAKFIGDWAVAIVDLRAHSAILAKDFVGTRHLYYGVEREQITWSTVLDPLVLLSEKSAQLNEEYLAGWFSFLPAAHLTPYENIHAVPPSSFVKLSSGERQTKKYWDFDSRHTIRYRTDAEYEDHFRIVFQDAVRRRLRCDSPILAELSGGMDSSSIVCVADSIIASESLGAPRIDTVSYYDDSEPNWNERPYFSKVEEKRGCVGCHIDVSVQDLPLSGSVNGAFPVTPGSTPGPASEITRKLMDCMSSRGNRVILSGIGGDEVTGGVPTPVPELQDLFATLQFQGLANRLKLWALQKRKPWFHVLIEAVRPFLPTEVLGLVKQRVPPPWLRRQFVERNRAAVQGYPRRVRLFGALPSFQENIATLEVLRRQVACESLSSMPLCERRYPFLDRDLLEFMYAIPREQLVRPGQRRSLMRRALAGSVPDEILNRKRKAFVSRRPITALSDEWPQSLGGNDRMVSASLGIVDLARFRESLLRVRQETHPPVVQLIRTFEIEHWLRDWQQWTRDRMYDGRVACAAESTLATAMRSA